MQSLNANLPASAVFYRNCSVLSGHFATIPRYRSCKEVCFSLMIQTGFVFSFVFHFFFHAVSLFDSAMFDSSFLLLISSRSPSFDSNLMTFLHFFFCFYFYCLYAMLTPLKTNIYWKFFRFLETTSEKFSPTFYRYWTNVRKI